MEAIKRYELIRPILYGEKTVKQIHQETGVPISTLYRYLKRFREGNGQIESIEDQSHAAHSHPNWFTEEEKDKVVWYKLQHPEKSAHKIALDMTASEILCICPKSVDNILKQRSLTEVFF